MKHIYTILMVVLLTASAFAQAPQKMSYQAVIRNANNHLVSGQSIGMRVSILQGSATGTAVYVETHSTTTNANGLVSIEIGGGTIVSGDFSTIDWATDVFFIKTETDPSTSGGGSNYVITTTSQLLSVAYALHSETAANYIETDPVFDTSAAGGITSTDITNWDNKLDTETDPVFGASVANGITDVDTAYWNDKLDSYTETDPVFGASVANGITDVDTAYWNAKLDSYTETDPVFDASVASGITDVDTAYWNDKLDSYTETDPIFDASAASNVSSVDINNWNDKLDTETDPVFDASVASGITDSDTAYWNDKLDSYTETDPVFGASVASGITDVDTANWNSKTDFDGDFSSLYNAPNMANSVNAKGIQLNTNDATSSVNITKANGSSVLKVDGTGRMTGDGSGLSNVKPLINYTGGDQRMQITANYGHYQAVRTVTLTVPTSGVCFAIASGYVDWESKGWDVFVSGLLMDKDPNTSWSAENEWYSYLNILTDYNCPDSTDQYTSFSQQRCFTVSPGTHTFYLWANKYSSASITEVGDVNLTVMFFPTGGTGSGSSSGNKSAAIRQDPIIIERINPNSPSGNY